MHPWALRNRFRRAAFGWKGSKLAIERMHEALVEIRAVARQEPCCSALFKAGRHNELQELLSMDPRPIWPYLVWGAQAARSTQQVDQAQAVIEQALALDRPMSAWLRRSLGLLQANPSQQRH